MKTLLPLSFAALLLSSTAVFAQDQALFDRLDSDGDDRLSFSDLIGEYPDLTQQAFDAADLDGDDFLDITQFGALETAMSSASTTEVAAAGTVSAEPAVDWPPFETLDLDANGRISIDDLTDLGVNQEQFDQADINNDDFLDAVQYEALKNVLAQPGGGTANVAVGMAQPSDLPLFETVDADGDGMVDFSTLKTELPDLTQEQFDAADIDNDNFLDRTQYEALNI